jgi:hypothetical protein
MMMTSPDPLLDRASWVPYAAGALLLLIGIWLLSTLYHVTMEFDDGYSTIANARHLAGFPADYSWSRAPLWPAVLVPIAWLADWAGFNPLDVRPYHVVAVTAHLALLIWAWQWLARRFGPAPTTLLAFVTAVPTVVFFSYAPFLSHDLIGGFFALALLDRSLRFIESPSRKRWFLLVLIGAAAAMVKQTFALFWPISFVAITLLIALEGTLRESSRALALLALAAITSGLIVWIAFAWALDSALADTPFWLRPWVQTVAVSDFFRAYGDLRDLFYQWVYLRNLWAFGVLTMILIVPGIYFCWKSGDRLLRLVAICWPTYFLLMHLIAFKEVRYLAFLAPFSAVLACVAIRSIIRMRRVYFYPLLAIMAIDVSLATSEARRIFDTYYKTGVSDFLAEAGQLGGQEDRRIIMANVLSFVSPERMAFHGDRYHRITHIMPWHLKNILGMPADSVIYITELENARAELLREGDVFTFSNMTVVRNTPIPPDNATTMGPDFIQYLAVARTTGFRLNEGYYEVTEGVAKNLDTPFVLLPSERGTGFPIIVEKGSVPAETLVKLQGWTEPGESADLTVLELRTLCTIQGCRRIAPAHFN